MLRQAADWTFMFDIRQIGIRHLFLRSLSKSKALYLF